MTQLTQQDVLEHQQVVPWPNLYQVEQDLLLCRSMVAIFEDDFLSAQVAMRGGTVLHKVHLAPACRYSEDIDLVAIGDRRKEHLQAAIKRVLRPVLGTRYTSAWALPSVCTNLFPLFAEFCSRAPMSPDDGRDCEAARACW